MRSVWHLATMGNYKSVASEQLELLASSGITAVDLSHVGTDLEHVLHQGERTGVKLSVVSTSTNLKLYERPALEHVERLAHEQDEPIMYFHGKGVSQPRDRGRQVWRKVMNRHVVGNWRSNLVKLEGNDCIGVNWHTRGQRHFSGNYWIATADHIRSLPNFKRYFRSRYSCEMWVGARRDIRPVSLLFQNIRWYMRGYDWAKCENDHCPTQQAT